MNTPNAMAASPQVGVQDPEALAYFSAKQREQWRRRTLPVLGLFGLVFLWWAVVAGLDVKPFIAPSPQLVVQTMINKWPVLWQNVIPTAIEARSEERRVGKECSSWSLACSLRKYA